MMVYTCTYRSKLGDILLADMRSDLWDYGLKDRSILPNTLPRECISQETPVLTQAKAWLDLYFSGQNPRFTPVASSCRFFLPAGRVENFIADPLWSHHDIW